MQKKKKTSAKEVAGGQKPKKAKAPKTKVTPALAAAAPAKTTVPTIDNRTYVEGNVHYFCEKDGWIALTDIDDFRAGKTKQFSFHQVGSLPGQERTKAGEFATALDAHMWGVNRKSIGNTVADIINLAAKPDNDMKALLDVAVAGYQRP